MDIPKKRIALYTWKVFNQEDIRDALEENGCIVDIYSEELRYTDKITGEVEHDCDRLCRDLSGYDAVFSLNFFSHLSNVCEKIGVKYIAWTIDSPLITLYDRAVYNDVNYIFIFDKVNYLEIKQMGVKKVFYLPLAVNEGRVSKLLQSDADERLLDILNNSDITFVGSLYERNAYDDIYSSLSPYLRGYFDSVLELALNCPEVDILSESLTVEVLEKLLASVDFKKDENAFSDLALVFRNTFLGFKLARMERIDRLNALSDYYRVSLFSDNHSEELGNTAQYGQVSYLEEMPYIFNKSKINLNMTIKNIRSGIPLRVWDVLGTGGFLLTNYQIEMSDFFNDDEIAIYGSREELLYQAEYFMKHEDERETMAANAHRKVKNMHTINHRVSEILTKVYD